MRVLAMMATFVLLGSLAACGGGKSNAPSTGGGVAIIAATAPASTGAEPFQVLSSTAFLTAQDTFNIDGEVRNNSGQFAGEITITIILLDAKQKPIQVSTTETSGLRRVTPPGETTPFDYGLPNGKKLKAKVASYQLTAEGAPTDTRPVQGLAISSEKVSTTQGGYNLEGRLTNTSSMPIKGPEVIGTFYDATGKVVRVEEAVFSEDAFAPGQGDDFSFGFLDGAKAGIARYVLATQADQ